VIVENPVQAFAAKGQSLHVAAAAKTDAGAKAAREFESMFMGQFVDEMMKTVKFSSFSGGFGEDMWRSFMSTAIADQIVNHSRLGLAGNIEGMLDAYKK